MKAILIDSEKRKVSYVIIDKKKGIKEYYKLLKCDLFTLGMEFENQDALFVDDEGLLTLTPDSMFFYIEGAYQPFAGNGLILGTDDDGDSVDVKTKLKDIKDKIRFLTIHEVRGLF